MVILIVHQNKLCEITNVIETEIPKKYLSRKGSNYLDVCTQDRFFELNETLKTGGTVTIKRKGCKDCPMNDDPECGGFLCDS